jgi:hypothetical protein
MNFVKNIFYSLCEIIFCLSISIISILIPLNYIYGSIGIKLTFFQSILPAIFYNFTIPTVISYILLFKYGIIFKIPTMISTFVFYMSLHNKKIYEIIASLFLLSCFIVLLLNSFGIKIWWYSYGWILSILIMLLCNLFKYDSIFLKSFVSVWTAHAAGTLIFIFYPENNLNIKEFISLIPICFLERTILAIFLTLVFYISNFLKLRLREYICIKNITKKRI